MIFERHNETLALAGVMYTAAANASPAELDAMVPLSVAQWHRHVNFCLPPPGTRGDARFGFGGSIATQEACTAAKGRWKPQLFGWMVHVWPLEGDAKAVWAVHPHGMHGHGEMAM